MSKYDMVCNECHHAYVVHRQGILRKKDQICPECGSNQTRQTFTSFLRNFSATSSGSNCGPRIGGFG